jgi:hypothetical protein
VGYKITARTRKKQQKRSCAAPESLYIAVVSTTAERRAQNEALFRDLNERVKEIDERLEPNGMGTPAAELEFLCECGNIDCATRFTMSRPEYEALRQESSHFAVLPGHVDEKIEHVVEVRPGYVVVEKDDEAAEVARETDPRD